MQHLSGGISSSTSADASSLLHVSDRADEYVDVCVKLWEQSWGDTDAFTVF